MNYRTLGRTGWKVSEISFGAWALGGTWGAQDDAESIAALRRALDQIQAKLTGPDAAFHGQRHGDLFCECRQWFGRVRQRRQHVHGEHARVTHGLPIRRRKPAARRFGARRTLDLHLRRGRAQASGCGGPRIANG